MSQPLAAPDGRYGCVPSRSRADLPAKYRVPLYRYHYEGYSFAEVGERLRLHSPGQAGTGEAELEE